MAGSNEKGDLQAPTETAESLEGEQKSQIGDMLTAGPGGGGPVSQSDESAEQESFLEGGNPGDELARAEPEAEEEPEVEDEYDSSEDFEEEEVEEPKEEASEDGSVLEALQQQNQRLEKLLKAALEGKQIDTEEAAATEQPARPEFEVDTTDLISDEDLDKLDENPTEFLRDFAKKILTRAREHAITDMSEVFPKTARREMALAEAKRKFFQDFPDVAKAMESRGTTEGKVSLLVRQTANEIAQEHPGWPIDRVFNETGKEIRALLKLDSEADSIDAEAKKRGGNNQPKGPKSKRRGKTVDKRSGLRKEIDEMLDTVS